MSARTNKQIGNGRIDPLVWRIAGVVLFGPLMTSLDSTIVNVSLSRLGQELHASLAVIQWVTSGYLLALALMLPLSGWLVDRIGAKRVYLGCFAGFTAASMLCGAATSAGALIAFRALQGMAGGLLAPMAQMMTARAAGRHVARVMGFMVMPVVLGPIFGPALAGVILQHASWRWIFFINLPIGIFATLRAIWVLPDDAGTINPRAFDLLGFLLLSPGLVFLLHSLESLSSNFAANHLSQAELLAALGLVAAFLVHGARRGREALIDVHLFRRPNFSAAASTQFLGNAVIFGGQMLLPLYLLMARNISPTRAGTLLAPIGLGMLCAYPMMGPLTERFGSRRVSSSGALISLLGTLPFALWSTPGLSTWSTCFALFVRGVGLGSITIPSIAAAYASIPKETIPVATTAINIVQRFGGPVATTGLAIFLNSRMRGNAQDVLLPFAGTQPDVSAFGVAFWLLCAVHAACFIAALRLPSRPVEDAPGQELEQAVAALAE
jgi:EmrB/QacA subfamily drug resistance transporter